MHRRTDARLKKLMTNFADYPELLQIWDEEKEAITADVYGYYARATSQYSALIFHFELFIALLSDERAEVERGNTRSNKDIASLDEIDALRDRKTEHIARRAELYAILERESPKVQADFNHRFETDD